MAVVTRQWSTDEFTQNGPSVIEFDVTGATSRADAIAAVNYPLGAQHDEDARQIVEFPGPSARKASPDATGHFIVTVRFSIPDDETQVPPPDPEDNVPVISWSRSVSGVPTDINIHLNKIRNAAGDGYSPKANFNKIGRTFRVTRLEAFYDVVKAARFEETVNESNWTISNTPYAFLPQTVKCLSIMPAGEYRADALSIPIAYEFEVRGGYKPHQTTFINQGRNGWYQTEDEDQNTITVPGPFVDGDGNPVSEDVLLDNSGIPLDSSIKVGEGRAAPVANPNQIDGYEVMPDTPGPAIIHVWDMVDTENFNEIGL